MKSMKAILFAALLLIAIRPASADTVELKKGGKVDGTVDEVVFLQEGKEKAHRGGTVAGVALSKDGPDTLRLEGGTAVKGELISIQIRSVGGLLTFKRPDLVKVTIQGSLNELRKEYLLRKAKLGNGDAQGLYDLALWCNDKGLKVEAREMARRCLAAEPKPETGVLAHGILGHVLRDGEWVDPATALDPWKEPADEPDPAPAKPEPVTGKIDPELIALSKTLAAEYDEKAKEAKSNDWDLIKTTYQSHWDKLQVKVRNTKKEIKNTERKKGDLSDDIRAEKRRGEGGYPYDPETYSERRRKERIDELRRDYDRAKRNLEKQEDNYKRALKDIVTLGRKINAAKAKARRRATDRTRSLEVARSKVGRLLRLGRKLDEAAMRAIFDEAVKD